MLLLQLPPVPQTPSGATLVVAPVADAEAWALSHDGGTLVGASGLRAFAWRTSEGEEARILSNYGTAMAVSDDGSVIVGNDPLQARGRGPILAAVESGGLRAEASAWIGTILSTPPPYGDHIGGMATGVSGDGSVVVGSAILHYRVSNGGGHRRAEGVGEATVLRLLPAEGRRQLGAPASLELGWGSNAWAVSRDGGTVVGVLPKAGPGFRWTEADGALPVGDLAGGGFETIPRAVSEDGSVIVGGARSKNGAEAFRWTAEGGMVGLGDLPGNAFRSLARGVSADGRIVVGMAAGERRGESPPGDRAFIWDAKRGMRDLWSVLAEQGKEGAGLPQKFSRWRLREAVAVRLDMGGHPQIAGTATDAAGRRVAFVATLGETLEP